MRDAARCSVVYEFNYHRPASVAEAQKLLAASDNPSVLAGGMTLLPTMKLRLAQPDDLIDLVDIENLRGIQVTDQGAVIGAMATHAEVAGNDALNAAIPSLSTLAGGIGDPQVRNRGTLGGSVANSDPAADYPAALLGLSAVIHTGARSINADDYFLGMFETALEEQEIIERIEFLRPRRAAYVKLPNPASRYAVVGVFVAEGQHGIRVAVTGAGPCAFRMHEMERALAEDFMPAALDGIRVDAAELNEDLHATAEYRAYQVTVMAKRAVGAILDR